MRSTLDALLAALGVTLVVATVAVVLLVGSDDAGGAGGGTSAPAVTSASSQRIDIRDFKFDPETDEIAVGSKLTFVNDDTAPHTATSSASKTFDTGTLRKGEEKTITVTTPGTYEYVCEIHPFMSGTLKVVE